MLLYVISLLSTVVMVCSTAITIFLGTLGHVHDASIWLLIAIVSGFVSLAVNFFIEDE